MNYEIVIGIEIHLELKTKTKMFSSSSNQFGNLPNTNVSPLDMAFPGTLPRLNKRAVEYAIKAATVLHCQIDHLIVFDRKNYFYPDLPKGYQITQDKHPIGREGYVDIYVDGEAKRIRIERLHMEEDTAKQLHYNDSTLIDYNRAGVPLVEIVSDADMRSGKEAAAYVSTLRNLLLYTGISDAKMEEGSMRCDVNISLRPFGQKAYGTKTEIKNLNSISNLERAVDFEASRQAAILDRGEKVRQETRRFDEASKETVLMREKTDAVDYKYFTEPNIMPITLEQSWIESIQATLPIMPDVRKKRYIEKYQLTSYDADVILQSKEVSDYFEACLQYTKYGKPLANWIIGDVNAYLNKVNLDITKFSITSKNLASLVNMVEEKEVSSKQAKQLFELMVEGTEQDPKKLAKQHGMTQISDSNLILSLIHQVLDENPAAIETYKSGRDNILGFLVGQVIKKSKGQANPAIASSLLREEINKR